MVNIYENIGADVNKVRIGIGSDSRIGYDFIYPGIGYGGACFPKEIAALIQLGKKNGYEPELISSVEKVNKNQKRVFFNKVVERFDAIVLTVAHYEYKELDFCIFEKREIIIYDVKNTLSVAIRTKSL